MKALTTILPLAALVPIACSLPDASSELPLTITAARPAAVDLLSGLRDPEPFTYAATNLRDPFAEPAAPAVAAARPSAAAPHDSLNSVALSQLQWLGAIRTPQQDYALLRTPDGAIHRAAMHERIAVSDSEIIAIDAQQLRLRDRAGEHVLKRWDEWHGAKP